MRIVKASLACVFLNHVFENLIFTNVAAQSTLSFDKSLMVPQLPVRSEELIGSFGTVNWLVKYFVLESNSIPRHVDFSLRLIVARGGFTLPRCGLVVEVPITAEDVIEQGPAKQSGRAILRHR